MSGSTLVSLEEAYLASFDRLMEHRARNWGRSSESPSTPNLRYFYDDARAMLKRPRLFLTPLYHDLLRDLINTGTLHYTALHQGLDRAMVVKLSRP